MSNDTTDTSKPLVDPRYVKKVFSILSGMIVQLDEDPLDYSPKRLNAKVQVTRSYMNEVERLALDASKRLHDIKEQYRKVKRLYQISEDKLLKSDSDVRAGRSIEDRRSLARLKMPDQADELVWFEQGIEDMETVLGALKGKLSGLRNIQGQLKEQRNLCNEGIGLGRAWAMKDKGSSVALVPGQGRGAIEVSRETQALIGGMEMDLSSDPDEQFGFEDLDFSEGEEESEDEDEEESEDGEDEEEEGEDEEESEDGDGEEGDDGEEESEDGEEEGEDESEDGDGEEEGEDEGDDDLDGLVDDLGLDDDMNAVIDGDVTPDAPKSKQGTMVAAERKDDEPGDSKEAEGDSLLPPEEVKDPSQVKEQDENSLSDLFDDDAFEGKASEEKTPEEEFLDLDGILDGIG